MLSKIKQTITNCSENLKFRFSPSRQHLTENWLQQGYQHHQLGEYAAAEKCYKDILALNAKSVDAHYLLGRLYGQQGQYESAVSLLEKAIALKPNFADAYADLGNVYQLLDQPNRAESYYARAIFLDDGHLLAHYNLGLLCQEKKQLDLAESSFHRVLQLQPNFIDAYKALVRILVEQDKFNEAKTLAQQAIQNNPNSAKAHACMGFVLQKMDQAGDALAYYQQALEIEPQNYEILDNMGIVLRDMGRMDEAIAIFDQAIALKPDYPLARWHKAFVYLARGDFEQAWPDYDLRLLSQDRPQRNFPYPRWKGTSLSGRTMLIYAEQGIGDEIMFASCLPDVITRAGHCVIECASKLAPLFKRSFPTATVHGGSQTDTTDWLSQLPSIDLQIPIGSLPPLLRKKTEDFPRHQGYLHADAERVAYWRERLDTLGAGLKVGISWRGGTKISRTALRSIPLTKWLPILQQQNRHFINLQYDEVDQELTDLLNQHGITVHNWQEAIVDYDETAALVTALDMTVSVCTALIHLGGALGRPVWIMAPFSPEWRYGRTGEAMPWYPSVRIFRQTAAGVWDNVVDNVAQELLQLAGNKENNG